MKIAYLTNMAAYHQVEFARAMATELSESDFRLVFHRPIRPGRAEMGWKDDYPDAFIIRYYQSEAERHEAEEWIRDADVVIQGRFPVRYVKERIRQGKLTFAHQERLWKKPSSGAQLVSRIPHLYRNYYSVRQANYHFLSIGPYAAQDLNALGIFRGRSWRFGYSIGCPDYRPREDHGSIRLLWCARLLEVKQPLRALDILEGLRARRVDAHLTMVGDGLLRQQVEQATRKRNLLESVTMTGWQSVPDIARHMQSSDLFLMTSHRGEGWGLVVNEAMSHGCGVMANDQSGAAAWLVESGRTGILYRDGELNEALDRLAQLDRKDILSFGRASHESMRDCWSARIAAQRFIRLSRHLLEGEVRKARQLYDSGPCSHIGYP